MIERTPTTAEIGAFERDNPADIERAGIVGAGWLADLLGPGGLERLITHTRTTATRSTRDSLKDDRRMDQQTTARVRGIVKANGLRRDKGFCFVTVTGTGVDVFCHKKDVGRFGATRFETHVPTWSAINEGSEVECVIVDAPKGPRAEQVTLVTARTV